ncbi:MAG: glycine oxidase ThiO [Actinomycetota bacterium]|nr:glycine oxidase ThiO [Actinomycetota bacterium]
MTGLPDVVVIGGGAIGLSIAWRSAVAGLRVTVVDDHHPARASWAAAGMIAPVSEAHYGEETLLDLNLLSARRYPGWIEELEEASDRGTGYTPCGTLIVALDNDDKEQLDHLHSFQTELGLPAQRLRGVECRELEPGLTPGVRAGLHVDGDHQIDNRKLVDALETACTRSGVNFVHGTVSSLTVEGERVVGAGFVSGDSISCNKVVLAAGCWSGAIEGVPPSVTNGVRPVKGQLLYLASRPGQPPLAQRNVRTLDVYVVARGDGRSVVGATVEELGFDTTVTAGGMHSLLRDAVRVLPDVAEQELSESVAGLRPGSRDNCPLLGPGEPEGLVVATGHYRNGILLTPATGDLIAELLVTDATPAALRPFPPTRFADAGAAL